MVTQLGTNKGYRKVDPNMAAQVQLDEDQRRVVDTILSRQSGILAVQGPAGSGKTTLVKALHQSLGNRLVLCSPTGKACARLSQKTGLPAFTIHSLLMKPTFVEEQDRGLYDRIQGKKGKMYFASKGEQLGVGKVLVVDEASMLTQDMCEQLEAYASPSGSGGGGLLVMIGDGFQLPPVAGGNFSVFDCGLETLTLSRVHRQQEGSDVIGAANQLIADYRSGAIHPLDSLQGLPTISQYDLIDKMISSIKKYGHQGFTCLTYKNSARDEITAELRKRMGYASGTLVEGEPLVITRNNRTHDIYNGDICLFKRWEDRAEEYKIGEDVHQIRRASLVNTRDNKIVNAALLLTASNMSNADRAKLDKAMGRNTVVLVAEYGYCLTSHKAQGSEWFHVLVAYDEMWSNHREAKYRWIYTSLTRAVESCTICELHRSSPLNLTRPRPPTPEQLAKSPLLARLHQQMAQKSAAGGVS